MGKKDKRIDAYIARAQPFAKPVLRHLRALVHTACPAVNESIKWSFPSFDYQGPLCSMAAFKQHVAFGFWKANLLKDPGNYLHPMKSEGGTAMGNFGRITSLNDLPNDKIILNFIKQAVELNEAGVKLPAQRKTPKKAIKPPAYFLTALTKNKKALQTFSSFSPSHKREYLEWITEAKTEATREKRLAQAIEWMAEGKPRNWKYMRN
ncbi:MAG: YdeI/OmpD-associated family protein [Cyclobacteriaceae bacterium]|nr:YdeI/OmpD-associated family protein [Cyclobacteriaceae bacterium]